MKHVYWVTLKQVEKSHSDQKMMMNTDESLSLYTLSTVWDTCEITSCLETFLRSRVWSLCPKGRRCRQSRPCDEALQQKDILVSLKHIQFHTHLHCLPSPKTGSSSCRESVAMPTSMHSHTRVRAIVFTDVSCLRLRSVSVIRRETLLEPIFYQSRAWIKEWLGIDHTLRNTLIYLLISCCEIV